MLKPLFLILSLIVLLRGGFSGITHAQSSLPVTYPTYVSLTGYRGDIIHQLLLVVIKNESLLGASDQHASADEGPALILDSVMLHDALTHTQDFNDFLHTIRRFVMKSLLIGGYTDFNRKPYVQGNSAIIAQSGVFTVVNPITETDSLDALLYDILSGYAGDFANIKTYADFLELHPISIPQSEYSNLGTLYLFKDEQDLRDLGYDLISRKTRTNTDPDYRRHNISAAFNNIGNIRVILAGEIFSLANEFHYRGGEGKIPYVSGYATFGSDVRLTYGGGLCGVATATYQGTLTNQGLALLEYRAHTIYYRNLYEAEINGITIKDPGLDATIFSPHIDFVIQNIREYPIVIVYGFDGTSGSVEQVFTLSKPQDKGSFSYVGMQRRGGLRCYTRRVNGYDRTNCYSKVTNY